MSVAQMKVRIQRIVDRQLGPGAYPAPRKSRLDYVQLTPAVSEPVAKSGPQLLPAYQSVYIVFRLNDNPLGRVWRLRAAKFDVFTVLKALYTSQLPVYDVEMDGNYPISRRKPVCEGHALVAIMDHSTAELIPWKRWGRDQEARLWSSLSYTCVSPQFA